MTRDDVEAAYGHLGVDDFAIAAGWCTTVEESHRVGRATSVVLGPAPLYRPKAAGDALDRYELEQLLLRRRRQLRAAELSPEEAERLARAREDQAHDDALITRSHRRAGSVARAQDRANRGQYLLPHERELLSSSA